MTTNLARRISIALLLGATTATAHASDAPGPWPVWDVGFLVGGSLSDGDLAGGSDYGLGEIGPVAGVRGGHFLGGRWNWFADAVTSKHDTELASGSADRVAARTGVEFFLGRHGLGTWFLSGAAGYEKVDFASDVLDLERPLGSLGVGQRIQLRNGTFFRWELRGEHLIGDDGVSGNTVDNAELLVGWSFGGGAVVPSARHMPEAKPELAPAPATAPGAPPVVPPPPVRRGKDSDGDGVPDRDDRCAFTPKGAWVDAKGCPTDFDHDGVFDGIDRCPDTPAGVAVDELGCPRPE